MINKLLSLTLVIVIAISTSITAQDVDLDDLLQGDTTKLKHYALNAFKSTRVINGHSIEMLGEGVLDVRIMHRFGTVESGINNLFGLDNASMRTGFDYGINKNLTIGIGRSTFNKELDGFVKYRLAHQHTGYKPMPVSIIGVLGTTLRTINIPGGSGINAFSDKLGYYYQLIVGRKFNTNFSVQLSPTFVHQNLVLLPSTYNDVMALGIGTRYKVTRRVAVLLDAYPILYGRTANMHTPLSIGVDIETGGHVFQLHFSNSTGMNEKAFIAQTFNELAPQQYRFGFNLSRVFAVKKNVQDSFQ
jgi:hypothetical protein